MTGMFWVAAGLSFLLLLIMRKTFPRSVPAFSGSYASLMRSLGTLVREQPVLREAAAINARVYGCSGSPTSFTARPASTVTSQAQLSGQSCAQPPRTTVASAISRTLAGRAPAGPGS